MKYKIFFSVILLLFAFLLASGTALAADISITTTGEFMAIDASASSGNTYNLMNDLDFTGITSFTPIGTGSVPFAGTFNGNGYIISNLTFSNAAMNNVGLFGYTVNASISNLNLKNIDLTGQDYVGSLIGMANNTSVSQCSVENPDTSLILGRNYVGGLIGRMGCRSGLSSISNSYAMSDVKGTGSVGGFIGHLNSSASGSVSISNCYATGNVTGTGYVGGFVGRMESADSSSSSISDCSATGDAKGIDNVGGFAGYVQRVNPTASTSISNSYAAGKADGGAYVGGFVGNMYEAIISNSYAEGDVTGTNAVGGFVGYTYSALAPSTVSNCYATGNATGIGTGAGNGNNVGGFVGLMNSNGGVYPSISNSYATGNAIGNANLGGFAGNMVSGSTIADSLYIGSPNNGRGILVTPAELMSIASVTAGGYVSTSWDISPSPDPGHIWYIREGATNPLFYWAKGVEIDVRYYVGSTCLDDYNATIEVRNGKVTENDIVIPTGYNLDTTTPFVPALPATMADGSTLRVNLVKDPTQTITINVRYYENNAIVNSLNTTVSIWAGDQLVAANVTTPAGYNLDTTTPFAPALPATMANGDTLRVNIVKDPTQTITINVRYYENNAIVNSLNTTVSIWAGDQLVAANVTTPTGYNLDTTTPFAPALPATMANGDTLRVNIVKTGGNGGGGGGGTGNATIVDPVPPIPENNTSMEDDNKSAPENSTALEKTTPATSWKFISIWIIAALFGAVYILIFVRKNDDEDES